jgi:hypothetical protein
MVCNQNEARIGARLAHILDLLAEANRLNVCAGELEVRPPGLLLGAQDGPGPALLQSTASEFSLNSDELWGYARRIFEPTKFDSHIPPVNQRTTRR